MQLQSRESAYRWSNRIAYAVRGRAHPAYAVFQSRHPCQCGWCVLLGLPLQAAGVRNVYIPVPLYNHHHDVANQRQYGQRERGAVHIGGVAGTASGLCDARTYDQNAKYWHPYKEAVLRLAGEKREGFSLIEALLSCALVVGIALPTSTVLIQLAGYHATDLAAQRTASNATRVISEFSAAMKSATSFAIYPDEATWVTAPNNATASGNFIVITTSTGRQLAVTLAGGIVAIINDPAGEHEALQCCSQAAAGGNGFVYQQDGVPALAWTVSLPKEQMQFQTCAYPVYMQ